VPLFFCKRDLRNLPAEPFADFSRGIAGALPGCALLFAYCLAHFGQIAAACLGPLTSRLRSLVPGVQSDPLRFPVRLEPVLPRCLARVQAILLDIATEFRALTARFRPLSPGVGAIAGPPRLSGGTSSQ
jgi:hypothetical protein